MDKAVFTRVAFPGSVTNGKQNKSWNGYVWPSMSTVWRVQPVSQYRTHLTLVKRNNRNAPGTYRQIKRNRSNQSSLLYTQQHSSDTVRTFRLVCSLVLPDAANSHWPKCTCQKRTRQFGLKSHETKKYLSILSLSFLPLLSIFEVPPFLFRTLHLLVLSLSRQSALSNASCALTSPTTN